MANPKAPPPARSLPLRRGTFQNQRPPSGSDLAQTIAAKNTHDRITPGVLGASMGGQGVTPQDKWDLMFPHGGAPQVAPGAYDPGAPTPAGREDPLQDIFPGSDGRLVPASARTPSPGAAGQPAPGANGGGTNGGGQYGSAPGAAHPAGPGQSTHPRQYSPGGPDLNSAAIQGALDTVSNTGKVVPTPSGKTVPFTVPMPGGGTVVAAAPDGKLATGQYAGNTIVGGPYGGGFSRQAAPSESIDLQGPTLTGEPIGRVPVTPAVTTSTGVMRQAPPPAWHQQVMTAHPEIGISGSEGNKAYVSAYNDAVANKGAGNVDPMALANQVMRNVQNQRTAKAAQAASGANDANEAQNKNFWDTSAKISQTPRAFGGNQMDIGGGASVLPPAPPAHVDLGGGVSVDNTQPTIGKPAPPVPPIPKVPAGTGSGMDLGLPGSVSATGGADGGGSVLPSASSPHLDLGGGVSVRSGQPTSTGGLGGGGSAVPPSATPYAPDKTPVNPDNFDYHTQTPSATDPSTPGTPPAQSASASTVASPSAPAPAPAAAPTPPPAASDEEL